MADRSTWQWTGIGVSVGAGLGVVVGLIGWGAAGLALGVAVGAGLGVVVGAAVDSFRRRGATPGDAPPGAV